VKNVIAVGPSTNSAIAPFQLSSPTLDGASSRDIVAKGSHNSHHPEWGVSQHAGNVDVVAGDHRNHGNLHRAVEKNFRRLRIDPEALKVLLAAGADDLETQVPITRTASVSLCPGLGRLIIADNNTGARIRTGDISQGPADRDHFLPDGLAKKFAWSSAGSIPTSSARERSGGETRSSTISISK